MARPVFLSYARAASRAHAQALADQLGELAFLDTQDLEDGTHFPQALADAVMDARVFVAFVSETYFRRWYCLRELELALSFAAERHAHIVLAIDGETDLQLLPANVANRQSPPAAETARVAAAVRAALEQNTRPLRERLPNGEAARLVNRTVEAAALPPPTLIDDSRAAGPIGASIGDRFVGRANDLAKLHFALHTRQWGAASITGQIAAGGGYGKTVLVREYLHRYGPTYYPGGLLWLDASRGDTQTQFYYLLKKLKPSTPGLEAGYDLKNARADLRAALAERSPHRVLFVADNVPETEAGGEPRRLGEFCPALEDPAQRGDAVLGHVTVLATSRQATTEEPVHAFTVDTLDEKPAVLLLTDKLTRRNDLTNAEWASTAEWVGYLPLALDLLNAVLRKGEEPPRTLIERLRSQPAAELGGGALAHLPARAAQGLIATFQLSYGLLDVDSQRAAVLLAQLGPAPIPEAVFEAMGGGLATPAVVVLARTPSRRRSGPCTV